MANRNITACKLEDCTEHKGGVPGSLTETLVLFARSDVLAALLGKSGERGVIVVKPGLFFRQLGERIFQVNPQCPEDYHALVQAIGPMLSGRYRVLHLWNLESEGVDYLYHGDVEKVIGTVANAFSTGAGSLVHLAEALGSVDSDEITQITYCYHGGGVGLQPHDDMVRCLGSETHPSMGTVRFERRPTKIAQIPGLIEQVFAVSGPANWEVDLDCEGDFRLSERSPVHRGVASSDPGLNPGGTYIIVDNAEGWGQKFADQIEKEWDCAVVLLGDVGSFESVSQKVDGVFLCVEDGADLSFARKNFSRALRFDDLTRNLQLDFFVCLTADRSGTSIGCEGAARSFCELRQNLADAGRRHGRSEVFEIGEFVSRSLPGDNGSPGARKKPRDGSLVRDVTRVVADTLGVSEQSIDLEARLDGTQFNSMNLAKLIGRLNKQFHLELSPPLFYEHKTLGSFTDYLIDRLGGSSLENETPLGPQLRRSAAPAVRSRGSGDQRGVAIVGIGGIFPGSPNVETFWRNLAEGHDLVSEIPAGRWDWRDLECGDPAGGGRQIASKWGGFVDEVDAFDASFFEISRREAELMDPQQRMLMEVAWTAVEDAGHRPSDLAGSRTGVFVGATTHDYYELLIRSGHLDSHLGTGTSQSILANRISFLLDLCGPSETIDTACSSSLVAVCRAVSAIESGECEGALVGGVNALLSPSLFVALTRAGMLCEDGRCKAFSEDANGYVRGEGAGMIWLKPLHQAEADRDPIYAVIRGGAVNHGGRVSSLTVPNPDAQAEAIIRCHEKAGVDPATVGYIEAHGSGTVLGDPIEINGLKKAFAHLDPKRGSDAATGSCGVGTVKSNIGHLESAAGIAGVLKVVMALQKGVLPASLHCDPINPYIEIEGSPFYIVNQSEAWKSPADGEPRRAGVSSFGFGGVNAHVLLEEVPAQNPTEAGAPTPAIIVLSAKSEDCLISYAENLLESLAHPAEFDLHELAFTLQVGRDAFSERLGIIASSLSELREKLGAFVRGRGDVEQLYRGSAQRNDPALGVIGQDDDLQAGVDAWMRKRKFSNLVELWVRGLAVDWNKLYGTSRPRRVSLPTYPFARERYWLPESEDAEPAPAAASPLQENGASDGKEDLLQLFRFAEGWQSSPLLIDAETWSDRIESKREHRILTISDDGSDFDELRAVCQNLANVVGCEGELWKSDHLAFSGGEAATTSLEEYLAEEPAAPLTIFLFLPKKTPAGAALGELELVFQWVKDFIRLAAARTIQFYCCHSSPRSDVSVYREGFSGLFRTAMLEAVEHRYRSITWDDPLPENFDVSRCLIQEWLSDDTVETKPEQVPMARFSQGDRFELQVREIGDRQSREHAEFREGGSYLMVGALGEMGELICRELGSRYRARLIILGRRSEADVKHCLDPIRAAGATVIYRSVDLIDTAALEGVLLGLKDDGEVINGVIQMARVGNDAPIFKKNFGEFTETISAKVQGSLRLDALLADEPLDFFLSFSSVAAFGIKGASDYAYATAFQNALARHRDGLVAQGKRSGRSMAICWGQFAKDGGVRPEQFDHRLTELRELGIGTIDATSAVDFLEASLRGESIVPGLIAALDVKQLRRSMGFDSGTLRGPGNDVIGAFERGECSERRFADYLRTLGDEDYTEELRGRVIGALKDSDHTNNGNGSSNGSAEMVPVFPNGDRQMQSNGSNGGPHWKGGVEEQPPLPERLQNHVEKVLKIESGGADSSKTFQEYGLDSITAMQLASRLEQDLGLPIKPAWLIDFPCIDLLAEKLGKELEQVEEAK